MVNLSTIYGVSIVLGSLAAMGSAYVGTKVYPIQTGGDPLTGPAVLATGITGLFAAAKNALTPSSEKLSVETIKEETPTVDESDKKEPQTSEPVVREESTTEPVVREESTTEPVVREESTTETPAEASTTEPVVREESTTETPAAAEVGGKRKLPPWFKYSGK